MNVESVWRTNDDCRDHECAGQPGYRVSADLMPAKVTVPAERHERRVDIGGERRGTAATTYRAAGRPRRRGDERAAERRVRHGIR